MKIPPLCTYISPHLEKSKINLALIDDVSFLGITPRILSASAISLNSEKTPVILKHTNDYNTDLFRSLWCKTHSLPCYQVTLRVFVEQCFSFGFSMQTVLWCMHMCAVLVNSSESKDFAYFRILSLSLEAMSYKGLSRDSKTGMR